MFKLVFESWDAIFSIFSGKKFFKGLIRAAMENKVLVYIKLF